MFYLASAKESFTWAKGEACHGVFVVRSGACFGAVYGLITGCCVGCFVGIPYATIDLMIENVITCTCNDMCGCVDVMKC